MYRHYLLRFEDIIDRIDRIDHFLRDIPREDFMISYLHQDAVLRNLEVIGEAAKHIPEEIRDLISHIPWEKIIGMRNIMSHEYIGVDLNIVWEVISVEFPILEQACIDYLKEHSPEFGGEAPSDFQP